MNPAFYVYSHVINFIWLINFARKKKIKKKLALMGKQKLKINEIVKKKKLKNHLKKTRIKSDR